tara:strand:- start:47746 stop:48015 length:270 start_codon:yes stop_codon:yes gene_type:complete
MLRLVFLWFYKAQKRRSSKAFLKKRLASINRGDADNFTENSNSFKNVAFGKYDIPGHLKHWFTTLWVALLVALLVWFIWESIIGIIIFS